VFQELGAPRFELKLKHDDEKVVVLTRLLPLPPGSNPGTHFC